MAEGRIIKALSGFYYVQSDSGVYACKGRGVFRNQNITPLVGDYVTFEVTNEQEGYVTKIHERSNELTRPPITNVTQAIIVASATNPIFSPLLLDRFLVLTESLRIRPFIVISKRDLVEEKNEQTMEEYKEKYKNIGYPVSFLALNGDSNEDVSEVTSFLKGQVTVLIGQSGVGKSTLLNTINPDFNIKTAEISATLGRGKHTTRHVELLPVNNGLVADTPGFSSLEFTLIEAEELADYFIDIKKYKPNCKFRRCLHDKEPHCAVKHAVDRNKIYSFRYNHYKQFLKEIMERKPRY